MQLFPYQIEGAHFLASRGRALLADEMGLGKSAQAIAAVDQIDGALSVGVVCPASVVENWRREIARFRVRHWTANVVSYNKAADAFVGEELDVLILDEAHYLKNHKAKRTKAIFGDKCDGAGGLVSRAKHVFLLTGTPTPNHPGELWPMLRAVLPGAIPGRGDKPLSYWPFVQRYCRTRDNGFGIQIVGGKNLDKLKDAISPYVLRRKKEEVLAELPPIRFDELPLEAHGRVEIGDAESVRLVRDTLAENGVAGLREIAPHVAQLRRVTGLAKVPAAIEWIKEQFEGGLKKMVVFAQHTDVLDQLHRAFDGREFWPARIDGSYNAPSRQAMVDKFQTKPDCKIFFGQIQAAGTGITLTAASDMLFLEQDWTPGNNLQAAMRIHRVGQKNACIVRFATLAGSIDEQIQRALARKMKDIEGLFA